MICYQELSIKWISESCFNGKTSEWEKYKAGVQLDLILGPLFFLIYINDLSDGISFLMKLSPDDTSLFSVVQNKYDSALQLNSYLDKVSEWNIHGKCLLTQILQNKHKERFF